MMKMISSYGHLKIMLTPPKTAKGNVGEDGYEYIKWPKNSETQWYRPKGGKADWKKWE